jgi:DNA repair protein RecO (recombination protein O)
MSRGARVYNEEAIVLRRVSTGETDRVLTLFCRESGKISAIAKGARGPRSRLAAATEPFASARVMLAQGQTLDVLTQAEVRSAFPRIRADLVRIGYAGYFLELIDAGLEDRQPAPEVWDLLLRALGGLEQGRPPDLIARAFELRALALLGYEPALFACVEDGAGVEAPEARFHPGRGGMVCGACAARYPGGIRLPEGTLDVMRVFAGQASADLRASLTEDARAVLACCMVAYVRRHVEAPLRSLLFIEQMSAPAATGLAAAGE